MLLLSALCSENPRPTALLSILAYEEIEYLSEESILELVEARMYSPRVCDVHCVGT